jgi:hypothetical protein
VASNCPCEACVEDPRGSGSIAQCVSQGMDCSCYTDCALCRLCMKLNGWTATQCTAGGISCDCLPGTASSSCSSGNAEQNTRIAAINAMCCQSGTCSNGMPTTCDSRCAAIFLDFWRTCASNLHLGSNAALVGVVSLCEATTAACAGSPCLNGGVCTATAPHTTGYRCICATGYSGIDCSVVVFSVPSPSLRSLAGTRLLVGTAANIGRIGSGQYPNYTSILSSDFSILTPENCMKMTFTQPAQGQWAFSDANALLAFAGASSIHVRAHNLIWTGRNPTWLVDYAPTLTPGELDTLMHTHITTTAGHFRGRVYSWDVVNEAIENHIPASRACGHWRCWLKTSSQQTPVNWNRSDIGDGSFYIERAFRYAAAADPLAKLFYNECT